MHVLAHLVAEAGGDLDQFDAALGGIGLQFLDRLRQIVVRWHAEFVEQAGNLRQRQWMRRREQGGLDDALES